MATETATPARPEPLSARTAWVRGLASPVRDFLSDETGGAVAMLAAAALALLWSNAPGWRSYESFWTTMITVRVGHAGVALDVRDVVNQGLMTLFFLVVGLEAKRELVRGELRDHRSLRLPAFSALGGMAGSVLVYTLLNAGGPGAHGWGAAMSTDTALALGVVALVAPGATRLRVVMLSIAVFDDLLGLLVVATVYTHAVALGALAVALGLLAALVALRLAPAQWRGPAAVGLGVGLWVALLESGIDPVISGLVVGLVTTAYPPERRELERITTLARELREHPTPERARTTGLGARAAVPPSDRLQYRLHPWVSFVIVPLFALANGGIHVDGDLLRDAISSPITLGIALGYVAGKPLGIVTAVRIGSWLSGIRPAVSLPVRWLGGTVAGLGFTLSLLVASIAFHGRRLEEAKLGLLAAIVLSTLAAAAVSAMIRRLPQDVRARQIAGTRDELVDLVGDVDDARDHIRGPHDALVTLVEYGDYECSYCGRAEPVVRELLASFSDDLRYVWRHLPLTDVHEHAQLAAEAAEAAAAQESFWEIHDKLLAHQDRLELDDLVGYARDAGLDVERFSRDLAERRYAGRVADDVATADASGVTGTPTFFINGRRDDGAYDVATLTARVRSARWRANLLRAAAA